VFRQFTIHRIRDALLPGGLGFRELEGHLLFNLDTNGYHSPLKDEFLNDGITLLDPWEPAAGMDIVKARDQYRSRLSMYGGIIFGLDRHIPSSVAIDSYHYDVDTVHEILDLSKLDRSL